MEGIEQIEKELGALRGRSNDLESMIAEIRGMKDPRNTMGRLDTFAGEMEQVFLRVGKLEESIVKLTEIASNLVRGTGSENVAKKRGRPSKKDTAETTI